MCVWDGLIVEGVIHTDKSSVTCQYATRDSWDPLYLCDVVVGEVFVTSCIQGIGITERSPQFRGDSFIVYFDDFCTDVISFGDKSSIPQEADTAKEVNKSFIGTYLNLKTLTIK